jgi:pilus assembly protein CpaE
MKVFLVDDNITALKMLGHAVMKAGYEVDVARDGIEALQKIPKAQPDVIIMDIMMPDLDGIEATRQLRANPATADIPIIMLTAKDSIEDKLSGFDSGADDYVVKPVLPAELIARIKAMVRRSQRYAAVAGGQRAHMIGSWGVKGGVGTTTLGVNLALAFAQAEKQVILADLHPWAGTMAAQLGLECRTDLGRLAEIDISALNQRTLERNLERHTSGVQVFAVPFGALDHVGDLEHDRVMAIVDQLETMAEVMILDLGNGLSPFAVEMIERCDSTVLVLEGDPIALQLAKEAIERLEEKGVAGGRLLPVAVNRVRSAAAINREQIEAQLGRPLAAMIAPAPEVFFHASQTGVPVLLDQPDGVVATQLRELSQRVA